MIKKIKRKIIKIDEEKCNGCGLCITECPEKAIEIVDTPAGSKARLVKEIYCDGLGACLSSCPTGALTIEEREAEAYDEEATIARIKEIAPDMLDIHPHKIPKEVACCPSVQEMSWEREKGTTAGKIKIPSELKQWPIQLHLVNPYAQHFKETDLIIVADCVPFAYANFHQDFLKDKAIVIGCPKLDDIKPYYEKIYQIIEVASPKSIRIIHMEVPCCFGFVHIVKEVLKKSKKNIVLNETVVSVKGEVVS